MKKKRDPYFSVIIMMKQRIKKIPVIGSILKKISLLVKKRRFQGSSGYWIERYKKRGDSGPGSYGKLAVFKSEVINGFVQENGIKSIIEFGCGDGNQLKLAKYPEYQGLDISRDAISQCRRTFQSDSSKRFLHIDEYNGTKAGVSMSLDVIYHLVEDDIYNSYMAQLFEASNQYVIIYSSNTNENKKDGAPHVKKRKFTDWIEANVNNFELFRHIPNKYPYKGDVEGGSIADFFIYKIDDERKS